MVNGIHVLIEGSFICEKSGYLIFGILIVTELVGFLSTYPNMILARMCRDLCVVVLCSCTFGSGKFTTTMQGCSSAHETKHTAYISTSWIIHFRRWYRHVITLNALTLSCNNALLHALTRAHIRHISNCILYYLKGCDCISIRQYRIR